MILFAVPEKKHKAISEVLMAHGENGAYQGWSKELQKFKNEVEKCFKCFKNFFAMQLKKVPCSFVFQIEGYFPNLKSYYIS